MVGIIICSHSNFAIGLKNACEMIAGEQQNFEALGFDGQEDLLCFSDRIREVAASSSEGCIFVCDLLNGTPFNACLLAMANTDNVVVTGASLPLVLELTIIRNNQDLSCEQIAQQIVESSRDYVVMKHSRDIF